MLALVNQIRRVLYEEKGLGTVELVVLVVVLIGLALLFRTQITNIMTEILDNIDTETITIQSMGVWSTRL